MTEDELVDFYVGRVAEREGIPVGKAREMVSAMFRPMRCPPDCDYAGCRGWRMTSRWLVPAEWWKPNESTWLSQIADRIDRLQREGRAEKVAGSG